MMRRFFATLVLTAFTTFAAVPAALAETSPTPSAPTVSPILSRIVVDQASLSLTVETGGRAETAFKVLVPDPNAPIAVTSGASWLTLSPALLAGGGLVTVEVNAEGFIPGSLLFTTINVQGGLYGNVEIPVVVAVTEASGLYWADPAHLDFGTMEPGQTQLATVHLEFKQPMPGFISTDAKWLDVQPKTFDVTTAQTILVKAKALKALEPGQTYTANITVQGNVNSLLEIPVTMTIAEGDPLPEPPPFTSPFVDVADDHWAIEAIVKLYEQRMLNGIGEGKFAPEQQVTREQFAKLLVTALRLPLAPVPEQPSYADVPLDRWSASYIEAVRPYLTGYRDGLFRPSAPATREDMAVALVLAKGFDQEPPADPEVLSLLFTDADSIAVPLRSYVAKAVDKGLMNGFEDGSFRPDEAITRAQAAVLIYRATKIGGYDKTAPW